MARALLVSYSGYPYTPSSLTPDNGLANLAGALLAAGHEVRVLDYGTVSTMRRLFPAALREQLKPVAARLLGGASQPTPEALAQLAQLAGALEAHQAAELGRIGEELATLARDFRPDFVGFKLWNGDGFSGSVALAEQVRRALPGVPIYAGGPQASWFGKVIYRRTQVFDALLVGEGEETILDLMEHAQGRRELGGIPGVIYRDGEAVVENPRREGLDLNTLPRPIYDEDVYPALAGDEKIKILVLDDSRGCPYACGFCTHPLESGRRLRTASARFLVDRMADLQARYGVGVFRFSGSSTPGSLMLETAEEILRRNLQVLYTCFGHFASARPDHFDVMAQSGLHAIFFGIESGCPEVLQRATGKPLKLEEVGATLAAARRAGIFTVASMIVPLPFDTEATLQESLEFLLRVRPDSVPVQPPGVLPGTPWMEHPEQYGFALDKEQVLLIGLDYKIKLLFPPAYWDPLPYTLHGLAFPEFSALTARFQAQLEAQGILTGVPDDNALIAHCAGLAPRQFRDLARLWCLTGDADALQGLAAQVNAFSAGLGG